MKEWGISVLLFMQYHLTVAIIVGFIYGMGQAVGVVLGVLLTLVLIFMGVLLIKRPANFGEYKNFFVEGTPIRQNYYMVVIVLRLALGVGIPLLNQSDFCGYFAIAVSVVQLLAIILIRPYKQLFRPIFNAGVILTLMIIYTIYRVRTVDDVEWMTTYLPYFLIATLFVTVLVNLFFILKHSVCYKLKEERAKKIDAI